MIFKYISILIFILAISCQQFTNNNNPKLNDETHTYSNFDKVTTTHLEWDVTVDFEKKQINGKATWHFKNKTKEKNIFFDTYNLSIKNVTVNNQNVKYKLTTFIKDFGSGLSIPINETDSIVIIEYHTGVDATALQWLTPEQTAGKKHPYLFTQCESIHARSLLPCQDVPSNRITYNATLQVPKDLLALMSAQNPIQKNETGIYKFQMEIPIPTYLIALAIGDIAYQPIDNRSGVYTEPSMLAAAAKELSDIPNMMKTAETIGGKYRWNKYDVLIAPPSFPIGGMENPRLTFATPTIIAGDKSLVSLIAHEMAHSWSGNLVTNATWNDLWLNEGFTTYFERRITEQISGKPYTDMLWELGYQDLQSDLKDLGNTHEDTRLKVNLKGREPGDAFTNVPYEKGSLFLKMLEENRGRIKFDAFLNHYFTSNAFTTMTSERCIALMDTFLFDNDTLLRNKLLVKKWIYEAGLPENCTHIFPQKFAAVDTQRIQFEKSGNVNNLKTNKWSTHEWLHFLRNISKPCTLEKLQSMDKTFNLTNSGNSEIAAIWYQLCIASNYTNANESIKMFLSKVGRKKFLEPLYLEMIKTTEGKKMALAIFENAKNNYHPLTALKIEKIIKGK